MGGRRKRGHAPLGRGDGTRTRLVRAAGTYCYDLQMNRDQTRLVADSGMEGPNGTFVLWDVKADKLIRRFGKGGNKLINAVAISPDGKMLASSTDAAAGKVYDIALWDADSGREIRRLDGHKEQIEAFVHSGQ